jgi:hypothetical protein
MAKSLLSIALSGARLLLFDNSCTGSQIGSPVLDAALTGRTIGGRILGASKYVTDIPFDACVLVTGNNLSTKSDTARRTVWIRLETTLDHPEERSRFKIANLLAHVREHRGSLACAALTVLRGFHIAGRPVPTPPPKPFGSFEAWSNLVRHACIWVGGHDPLTPRAEAVDQTSKLLTALVEGWAQLCKDLKSPDGITTLQALEAIVKGSGGNLTAVLCEQTRNGDLPSPQALGNLLSKCRGRPYAGRALDRKEVRGLNYWYVRAAHDRSLRSGLADLADPQ